MANQFYLSRSDRFKLLKSEFRESLQNADQSHLEPLPPYTPVEYVYTGDRDPRYRSPYATAPDYWYWRPVQYQSTRYNQNERLQARLAARLADLADRGLYRVFVPSLDAFILTTQQPSDLVDQKGHALRNLNLRTASASASGRAKFHFVGKNRQSLPKIPHSLPTETDENAKKVVFLPVAQKLREKGKNVWVSNTQTSGRALPKIAINRRDFLAR